MEDEAFKSDDCLKVLKACVHQCYFQYSSKTRPLIQKLLDVLLSQSTTLTDSQKRTIQGDACFLLICCSLREEQAYSHETIKSKFWPALYQLIKIYQVPSQVRITCLICALLLNLTHCSTVVKQLFTKWSELIEQAQ